MTHSITDTWNSNPILHNLHTQISNLARPFRINLASTKEAIDFPQRDRVSTSTSETESVWTESSTTSHEIPESVLDQFQRLFNSGKEEIFEDGILTAFSRTLVSYIERYGELGLEVLTYLILGEQVNPETVSEALRWIGRMNHPSSHYQRLLLLERSLRSSSARVRDGAILGLASMDDPSAIPYLEQAIGREAIPELRQDMEQVLAQLRATQLENAS